MEKDNELALDLMSVLYIIKGTNHNKLYFTPQSPLAQYQLDQQQEEIKKQQQKIQDLIINFADTFLSDQQKIIKWVKSNEEILNSGMGSFLVAECNKLLDK